MLQKFEGHDHWWDNVVEIWEFDATGRAYCRPLLHSTIVPFSLLEKLHKALFRWKALREEIE